MVQKSTNVQQKRFKNQLEQKKKKTSFCSNFDRLAVSRGGGLAVAFNDWLTEVQKSI